MNPGFDPAATMRMSPSARKKRRMRQRQRQAEGGPKIGCMATGVLALVVVLVPVLRRA
ncbi:hypothetical protein [Sciscionella sediminilitoris]|uniref:hypothetical protein n=1 Tax=Sciscionella sediminilitoris TaxID=1445613 RepID=UPI0012E10A95|nr:hypothetical protein [Sciscionella sp. SE31]